MLHLFPLSAVQTEDIMSYLFPLGARFAGRRHYVTHVFPECFFRQRMSCHTCFPWELLQSGGYRATPVSPESFCRQRMSCHTCFPWELLQTEDIVPHLFPLRAFADRGYRATPVFPECTLWRQRVLCHTFFNFIFVLELLQAEDIVSHLFSLSARFAGREHRVTPVHTCSPECFCRQRTSCLTCFSLSARFAGRGHRVTPVHTCSSECFCWQRTSSYTCSPFMMCR